MNNDKRLEGRQPETGSGVEVKPGYKLTEVGVIPEDWEVRSLGKIAHIERGK